MRKTISLVLSTTQNSTLIYSNIMDSRIVNQCLNCTIRQDYKMIVSEIVSNGILTESACQKVSWQSSATDLQSRESDCDFPTQKTLLEFSTGEKTPCTPKTFPIFRISFRKAKQKSLYPWHNWVKKEGRLMWALQAYIILKARPASHICLMPHWLKTLIDHSPFKSPCLHCLKLGSGEHLLFVLSLC